MLDGMRLCDVAKRIRWPLKDWPGNCYVVAMRLWRSGLLPPRTRAVYGRWTGPIAPGSFYSDPEKLRLLAGHAWLELPDGTVMDPTRYVFEGRKPYIYAGPKDFYKMRKIVG